MTNRKLIFRGYEIEQDPARGWIITLDGAEVTDPKPSEDAACTWIMQEKRRQAAEGKK